MLKKAIVHYLSERGKPERERESNLFRVHVHTPFVEKILTYKWYLPLLTKSMKHKKSRQETIYAVALAGVSAAVALLMVWLGVVVRFSTVAFFIAASIAIMIPASQKYYLSSIFAYIVSAGLSFWVAGDVFSVMGYVVYFGPMGIITAVLFNHKDKVKWWLALIIKVVYINGALAVLYFLCHNIVIDESIADKLQYWFIALFGTLALVAVDYVLQFVYSRAGILLSKALRKKGTSAAASIQADDEDDDDERGESPFDEFEHRSVDKDSQINQTPHDEPQSDDSQSDESKDNEINNSTDNDGLHD